MKQETRYIGWDYSGCIGKPNKTSLKRLVEHKVDPQDAQHVWQNLLERYGQLCQQYGKEHGEDVALLDFYQGLAKMGVNKEDFRTVAGLLCNEDLIRDGVVYAMKELKTNGVTNVIVTKNLAEEVSALAKEINQRSGMEVISDVVGAQGKYDCKGNLVGIDQLIGDYEGELNGVSRILKRDAVKRAVENGPLHGYVTDSGDKDIRQIAKTSAIIRSSVPYADLDEYFKISADKETGNYQMKVIADGVWDALVNDGKNLGEVLVKILQ